MRLGCVLLLLGCAEVVLDPHGAATIPPPDHGEANAAPSPSRGPTSLLAPACATASDPVVDFGEHIRPGMVARRSVRVAGCEARDVTITYVDAEGEGFSAVDVSEPYIRAGSGQAAEVEVELRPLVSGRPYAGTLTIHTDDPMRPRIEIALSGRGGWATEDCAPWTALINGARQPALAGPDDRLVLQANPPRGSDAKGARVRWTVIDRPADSRSQPVESFHDPVDASLGGAVDDADTAMALFAVDAPGKYLFEAEIAPAPASACPPQAVRVGIEACPCPGDLQVQVVWDLVEGEGPAPGPGTPTDLDLYLMHPDSDAWDDPALSCSAAQPTQPWDDPADISDDPRHDADASHAPGTENVFLDRLASRDGLYRVGVVQRRPFDWSATASVRVFVGDRMVWQATDRRMGDGDAFWDVAGVGWFEGRLVVLPIDRVYQTGGAFPDPTDPLAGGAPCLPDRSPRCGETLGCVIEPGADAGSCRTEEPVSGRSPTP